MTAGCAIDFADLLARARDAATRAYAPYSQFRVGAAVMAGNQMFTGCNIENASYGLAICAERTAVFQAIAAGHRRINAVALACIDAPPDGPAGLHMPCGACRQVLAEFAAPDTPIAINAVGTLLLGDLLPRAFSLRLE